MDILVTALMALSVTPAVAQQRRTLPFTQEQDSDGARYVWFMNEQVGLSYPYVPAREIPKCPWWGEVPRSQIRAGDVAWWPDFVALYDAPDKSGADLWTAPGRLRLSSEEKKRGPAKVYRRRVPVR